MAIRTNFYYFFNREGGFINPQLNRLFHPLTADPFESSERYAEYRPCPPLQPYVRCFWGTARPMYRESKGGSHDLVIPDACMDIIFNTRADNVSSLFCGMNDTPFRPVGNEREDSVFAIRFYFWSAPMFAADSLRDTMNAFPPADALFGELERELRKAVLRFPTMKERIYAAERILLGRMDKARQNAGLMNAVYALLNSGGGRSVLELSSYACVGERQLERLCREWYGISPKRLARLVRYQNLWRDVLRSGFDIQEAVLKFGYADQAHLLKEFRQYHTLTLTEAKKRALQHKMSDFYNTSVCSDGILNPCLKETE